MDATTKARPGRVFSKPVIGRQVIDRTDPIVGILGNGGTLAARIPGYQERRQQLDLATFIDGTLKTGEHGVGEAGTGVGKSFGYLVPLILSEKPAVIAVPTIALQTQLIEKDLPALAQPGVMPKPFTYALLKGRSNYICKLRADAFRQTPEFENRVDRRAWPDIADWLTATTDGDIGKLSVALPMAIRSEITVTSDECIGDSCPMQGSCYAETAKERAKSAQIIVTNLAVLMLDLRMRHDSGGITAILPDREIIGIDEGHRLREAAQSASTREVTIGRFERIARRLENLARKADAAVRASNDLRAAIRLGESPEGAPVELRNVDISSRWHEAIRETRATLRSVYDYYLMMLEESKKSALRLGDEFDATQDALVAVHGLRNAVAQGLPSAYLDAADSKAWQKAGENLESYLSDLVACVVPDPSNDTIRSVSKNEKGTVTLTVAPIEVADWLRQNLWSATLIKPAKRLDGTYDRSVCTPVTTFVVSATLTDDAGGLGYFRETVGLDAAREIVVGSPFDYLRHGVLYVPAEPGFDPSEARATRDPKIWTAYLDRLTDEYERLIRISRGRAFCLFTANTTLAYVYDRLVARDLPYPLLRQGDLPLTELVRQFKASGNAVLFGVKSYWEGVDVQGDALSMVIISGVPFTPPDDPHYAARCERHDRRYRDRSSFTKISIPEATISLKQAYGRGIRSVTDTAAICILDSRLRHKRYGAGIMAALPPSPLVGDLDAVADFFHRVGK